MDRPLRTTATSLSLWRKIGLTMHVWKTWAVVVRKVRRERLPAVVAELTSATYESKVYVDPKRLGRIVHRTTRIGPWSPRCLFTALVLYRMLLEQGDTPQLVIGLPHVARTKDAHAWVEIEGRDVGPPPGGRGHAPLARYGRGPVV